MEQLQASIATLARSHAIASFQAQLPPFSELHVLVVALLELCTKRKPATVPEAGSSPSADYDAYCTARDAVSITMQRFLSAEAFCKLPKVLDGTVPIASICQYARTKILLHHIVARLLTYDSVGDGCLREHDVENYVFEAIPGIPELAALQENFYPFYVFTAVRKFFFFLDPNRTGKIRVRDFTASRAFAEWMRLLPNGHPDLGPAGCAVDGPGPDDSDGTHGGDVRAQAGRILAACVHAVPAGPNWFSASSALRVYSQYLQLDGDQNGMLSASEMSAYRGGILTSACIERIFEECHTYGGEIDFKAYLDLILALENRTSKAAQRFMFKLLDVRHTGRVGLPEVRYFCQHVAKKLAASGQEPVDVANVCDEIFDMVHAKNTHYIRLDDILQSKVGHTACSIMLDAAAFFAYDRREELKGSQDAAEQPMADSDFEG